jgi:hypothetical protein
MDQDSYRNTGTNPQYNFMHFTNEMIYNNFYLSNKTVENMMRVMTNATTNLYKVYNRNTELLMHTMSVVNDHHTGHSNRNSRQNDYQWHRNPVYNYTNGNRFQNQQSPYTRPRGSRTMYSRNFRNRNGTNINVRNRNTERRNIRTNNANTQPQSNTFFSRNINEFINNTLNTSENPRSPLSNTDIIHNTNEYRWRDISVNETQTMCPITQSDFNSNDVVLKINVCGHLFKKDALLNYFSNYNHVCPVCRRNLRQRQTNTEETPANTPDTTESNNSSQANSFEEIEDDNPNRRTFYFDFPVNNSIGDYSNNLTTFVNNITNTLIGDMRNTMLSPTDDQTLHSTTFDFFLPQMSVERPRSRNRRNDETSIDNNRAPETGNTIDSPNLTTHNNEREDENIEIGESMPNEDILNQGLEETFDENNIEHEENV